MNSYRIPGHILPKTVDLVCGFYDSDKTSTTLPGKKDSRKNACREKVNFQQLKKSFTKCSNVGIHMRPHDSLSLLTFIPSIMSWLVIVALNLSVCAHNPSKCEACLVLSYKTLQKQMVQYSKCIISLLKSFEINLYLKANLVMLALYTEEPLSAVLDDNMIDSVT